MREDGELGCFILIRCQEKVTWEFLLSRKLHDQLSKCGNKLFNIYNLKNVIVYLAQGLTGFNPQATCFKAEHCGGKTKCSEVSHFMKLGEKRL